MNQTDPVEGSEPLLSSGGDSKTDTAAKNIRLLQETVSNKRRAESSPLLNDNDGTDDDISS